MDIYVAYGGTSRTFYGQVIIHRSAPKIKAVDTLSLSEYDDNSPKIKVVDALLPNTKKSLLQIHHHAIPVPLIVVILPCFCPL